MKCFPCTNNCYLYEAIKVTISSVDMIFKNHGSKYSFHWSYHESISILSGWDYHNYITYGPTRDFMRIMYIKQRKMIMFAVIEKTTMVYIYILSLFFLSLIECTIDKVFCFTHIYHRCIVNVSHHLITFAK